MPRKTPPIPVNNFGNEGIDIGRLTLEELPALADWNQPERHDRHSFFLVETGSVGIEIDFQTYHIVAPAMIYMHPDQVHLIKSFENVTVTSWAITNEFLYPAYLTALEEIAPAEPLALNENTFALICDLSRVCIKLASAKSAQKVGVSEICYTLFRGKIDHLFAGKEMQPML